jgi:hypothetical protein
MCIDGIGGVVGLVLVAPIAISALVAVFRGPRLLSVIGLLIGALVTVATAALYWVLIPEPFETVPLAIAVGLGALAGVVSGVTITVTRSAQGAVPATAGALPGLPRCGAGRRSPRNDRLDGAGSAGDAADRNTRDRRIHRAGRSLLRPPSAPNVQDVPTRLGRHVGQVAAASSQNKRSPTQHPLGEG